MDNMKIMYLVKLVVYIFREIVNIYVLIFDMCLN